MLKKLHHHPVRDGGDIGPDQRAIQDVQAAKGFLREKMDSLK